MYVLYNNCLGHKQCYRDLKTYYRTKKELESGEKSLVHLTRHELEVLLLVRKLINNSNALFCFVSLIIFCCATVDILRT